ncbi:purine permease [Azospirillum brasilense]|uniref:Nucleobase:cation symporter-2 family protein n=1 Tax=Azospirillum brasilense TaxID=192 RepID=A0A0P0EXN1_AZOBR|nr:MULTISPECIES: nucleobase:cation symporter-2 family protein [Azospirillum]ALJ39109.1 purine permease [Azospirillum brasilense]MDW7557672.1 nucleobase:cation symporter-2 family protein [Azospirillum brasilense]MDW7595734.1 nucleobase:cation symporter-2 family protein [Azospirillum brasilense]MDW7630739.1 nucleobase:cation symporter-2 family protein [Azospirillum brasilense]MDX5950470.1 nucleobase:cation symporter-2 family protein [Azospirillum brasilense]
MSSVESSQPTHPVDEKLPLLRLLALGMQHVMVMYAGAIAVPLIIGGALKLPKDQIALLINADLFACGIVTLIQTLGFWKFGIRLPVMMGVTFAAVGPMVAMAGNPSLGLLGIYGAVIGAGVFATLAAPLVGRLLPLFPPVVTGTVIAIIGISLMRVGITWAGGGAGNPNFGDPLYLGIALFVLAVILLVTKYAKGFWANISVLLGIVAGFALTMLLGLVSFDGVGQAKWVDVIYPFQFGMPVFEFWSILTMSLVMIVVMIESTGMFLAVGEMVGRPVTPEQLTRGLRTDGLGTLIGGVFNTFPYTSFSQNVGLVGITGVRSRWVCVAGGVILVAFGLFPKLAHVVASVPTYVLGGAGLVMFGMVAATGIKILAKVDYTANRGNIYVVADKIFQKMPPFLSPLLHSGILLGTIAAVLLNLFFNGLGKASSAEFVAAAKTAEA